MQSVGLPTGFGKYCLLAKLATGGMGELFLSRMHADHGFEKLVVIKRILPHLTDKPEFVDMFVNEARIAARLSHPNICQIYELGVVSGRYYMALEYLEGVPLVDVLLARKHAHRLGDMRLVIALMMQACEGIHGAHQLRNTDGERANIVHRDLNPRNIFITTAGVAKILDFGVAKVRGALAQTRTGSIKGTYSYMSPEQLLGEPLDGRSDVFALGVCTWESVVGRRLFKRESDFATWKAICEQPIPRPSEVRADVPPALDDAIARALAPRREDRFSTAREFALAMDRATAELGAPLSTLAIAAELERVFEETLEQRRNLLFEAQKLSERADTDIESIPERAPTARRISNGEVAFEAEAEADATIPQPSLLEHSSDPALAWPPITGPHEPLGKYPIHSLHTPISGSGSQIGPSAVAAQVSNQPEESRSGHRGWIVAGVAAVAIGVGIGFVLPALETGDAVETAGAGSRSEELDTDRARVAAATPRTAEPTAEPTLEPTAEPTAEPTLEPTAEPSDIEPTDAEPMGAIAAAVAAAESAPAGEPAPAQSPRASKPAVKRSADKSPAKTRARESEPEPRARPDRDQDEPASGHGSFTVTATPYATVFIDGKKHGVTPLARVRLRSGKHRVRLVSSDKTHKPKQFTIEVAPNGTIRKKVSW